jgi:small subunit ribosomal protein S2
MIKFSLKQLFNFNIHVGHAVNRWNPKAAAYLYGMRNNIHIINLENTLYMLRRALFFISDVIQARGNLLVVNLKVGSYKYLELRLKKFSQFFVNVKYIGGLLTNFKNVKGKYNSLLLMYRLPSVVFVSNLANCVSLVQECKRLNIPLVGITDSNYDPAYFDYPIPGNTESLIATRFYYSLLFKAIHLGILKRRFKNI